MIATKTQYLVLWNYSNVNWLLWLPTIKFKTEYYIIYAFWLRCKTGVPLLDKEYDRIKNLIKHLLEMFII